MAALHGFEGNVTFAAGYTTSVKAWTATLERATENTLAWDGDSWQRAVQGGKTISGTYTCNVDDTTNFSLTDLVDATGSATFQFVSGYQLRITIKVTGSDTGADIEVGPEEVAINWTGHGKPEIDPPGTASVTASVGA